MKKITLCIIASLAVNFLFAVNGKRKSSLLLQNPSAVFSGSNNLNGELKKSNELRSQPDGFKAGGIIITAGYGIPNIGKSILNAFKGNGGYSVTGFGPIHIKGEYGLSDKISLGVSVNYVSFGAAYDDPYDDAAGISHPATSGWDVKSLSILARMNVHFGTNDKMDPYFGVGAGYKNTTWTFHTTNPNYSNGTEAMPTISSIIPVGFETSIGLRYYFTDNIGIYGEVGLTKSLLQGGLAVKF